MVGTKVCLSKQHCHSTSCTLIPTNEEPRNTIDLSDDMFHVSETLLYTNASHTTYVKVEKIYLDEEATLRIRVRTKNEEIIDTTKESL